MVLVALLFPLQDLIDRSRGGSRLEESALMAWSGATMRKLAPGFEGPVADLYWLRTVQYYGGQRAFSLEKRFELVAPLIDVTVTLDPRMIMPYRLGAIFLSETHPNGAGRPDAGVKLLERGIRANPKEWRLRQDLAYLKAEFQRDYAGAASVLMAGALIEGAPAWFRSLAGAWLQKGGDRRTSRIVWQGILTNSPEEFLKQAARRRLRNLDSLDAIDGVKAALLAFERDRGRRPESLAELVQAGFRGRTASSDGFPFEYDPATLAVTIKRGSLDWQPR